ncbi:sulfite exporter TauE/SafE family protein [Candidatus Pelagibacter ubique]|nr:sulfite exporter TauE/SafE family protein [Candidatus Pelagibacter ubique]
MIILSFLFLLTATLYSSVGFGGGSTYLALLLIWDIPYLIFPVIALFCNIIVVSGNCINYIKAGNINFKILTPYLISSVPLAFIGGSLSVDKEIFEILLFLVLSLAGVLLLMKFRSFDQNIEVYNKIPKILSLFIGASIGFVSGVVGIGGGIFLSPILLLIRVDKAKNIATAASLFILINSLSGIAGQLTKTSTINGIYDYWPLFLFVLIGGQLGNFLNIKIFPARILTLVTSALVIFVAIRMGLKLFA